MQIRSIYFENYKRSWKSGINFKFYYYGRFKIATEKDYKVNDEISAVKIRLVGEKNEALGIVSKDEAIQMAEDANLDLVEIAPQAEPIVCRLMDFGKFRYKEQKKITWR